METIVAIIAFCIILLLFGRREPACPAAPKPAQAGKDESETPEALVGMALGGTFDPVFTDKEREIYDVLGMSEDGEDSE